MVQTAEQKLLAKLQRELETLQESLDKFATKFAEDPAYALSWGHDTFEKAARQRKVRGVIVALESGKTIADVRELLTSDVLHRAKYPAHSTSVTSNLIEQYELAASADLLSDLRHYA